MVPPYPGYAWSLTQHMGRITPHEIFALLAAGYEFRSQANYRNLINQELSLTGIFTENIRQDSGRIDTWRDYQQILSELGLIYSTRYVEQPYLTPLGLMYIDGTLGYSELFSIQALAYQYPNGHKTDISASLKRQLLDAGVVNIPSNRAQLDYDAGVLIKPGVLILQILIELYQQGQAPTITTSECLATLVNLKRNTEWNLGYQSLLEFRQGNQSLYEIDGRKRPVQEWFRFLGRTDFANLEPHGLSLSEVAVENLEQLQTILDYHADPLNFWMPQEFNERTFVTWYAYYGEPSLESQWFTPETLRNQSYLEQNFIIEPESIDEQDIPPLVGGSGGISLRPFNPRIPIVSSQENSVDTNAIVQGRRLSREKTRQHQEVVAHLATRLTELSYNLSDDPNSLDLLAEKDGYEIIFEVKTITKRNAWYRIRLGVGQLLEYRYRRERTIKYRPYSILVLSNILQLPTWSDDYFSSEIQIGIICSLAASSNFSALTNGLIEQEIQNY